MTEIEMRAAIELLDLMEHISSEYWSAGWCGALDDGELFRRAFDLPVPGFGWQDPECAQWSTKLRKLAERAGVWWVNGNAKGNQTITLDEARRVWSGDDWPSRKASDWP